MADIRVYSPSLPDEPVSGRYVYSELKKIASVLPSESTLEAWHEVGATGEPAFENSWANYGGVTETAGFYKDHLGRIYLKGCIKSGTSGTVAFTLPTGYRPSKKKHWPILQIGDEDPWDFAQSRAAIATDGTVTVVGSEASAFASLENINFRI